MYVCARSSCFRAPRPTPMLFPPREEKRVQVIDGFENKRGCSAQLPPPFCLLEGSMRVGVKIRPCSFLACVSPGHPAHVGDPQLPAWGGAAFPVAGWLSPFNAGISRKCIAQRYALYSSTLRLSQFNSFDSFLNSELK